MTSSKRFAISLAVAAALMAAGAAFLLAALSTDMDAAIVIGHEYFSQTGQNEADPNEDTFSSPYYAYATASKLFVADFANHRVLIFNSIPTTDGDFADVVVGQADMQSSSSGTTSTNLNLPRGVFYDGTRLFIADQLNNRVLIYNTLPTVNGAAADVVVGQADMNSNAAACTASGMQFPYGVFSDGTKLFVASFNQHRVLIYNTIPTSDGASADVFVGQPNNSTCTLGTTSQKLKGPSGVFSDGSDLYVSDMNNHRVLIYTPIPTADNDAADIVIGQANFTSGSANRGGAVNDNTLSSPRSVYVEGSKLFIADGSNNRVLIYNSIPVTDGASADVVVGQSLMTTNTPNNGGIAANRLSNPGSATSNGTKFFVADINNHRVLIFNSIPTVNNTGADIVVGQTDFVSNLANQSSTSVPSAYSLRTPYNTVTDGTNLYIADQGNNRVLIYNSIPYKNHAAADVVVGQAAMNTRTTGITASTMNSPYGVFATASKLFVADGNNNRVLIYNSIPAADGASADIAVGQPDLVSNTANNGGIGANTMWKPYDVYATSTTLIVTDGSNNRVLIYESMPAASNASADVVVGQPDMFSSTANNGGIGANTLSQPWSAMAVNGKLFIADRSNNRVLIYNTIPGSDGASANVVVGQPDMFSNSANNGGIGAATLSLPGGVYSDGVILLICDQGNNRILVYNSIPTADGASADMVIGQADFVSNSINQGGSAGPNTIRNAYRAFYVSEYLYVGDTNNSRSMIYKPYVERGQVIRMW